MLNYINKKAFHALSFNKINEERLTLHIFLIDKVKN